MTPDLRDAPAPPPSRIEELEHTCFVIMPFGQKEVGGKEIDFTAIYEEIFAPAIRQAKTPEGHDLCAARTDMDAFSGSINQDMFEYLMYSRLAFADISGFNPNVFYEIGARHSVQESGTVLFRQTGHAIPFDITTIKVFEYEHQGGEQADRSRERITRVLTETLRRNRLDSPVRLALRAQWGGTPRPADAAAVSSPMAAPENCPPVPTEQVWRKQQMESFLRDGEEAIRLGDLEAARTNYWGALRFDPLNIVARMRLGLVLKRQGKLFEAFEEFVTVTKIAANYGEAWKEKGVVEGLIARLVPAESRKKATWLPDGYDSLQRASLLIPGDFDVWSSLGGVLKNVRGDPAAAREMYAKAAEISDGHPYPLLNSLKLEAKNTGRLNLEAVREPLQKAEKMRLAQTIATPPVDVPWCYFDLAEIALYQENQAGFLQFLDQGTASCIASWQPETFKKSLLDTFASIPNQPEGLQEGIARLDRAIAAYAV